jgi:hypothetical protein
MQDPVHPPTVFLAMPHNGPIHAGAAYGLHRCGGNLEIMVASTECSILCHNFNLALQEAFEARLTQPIDYVAYLHADIMPLDSMWLQIGVDELRRTGADAIAAVAPIKTNAGETSTAIDSADGSDPYLIERKLTMQEVCQLPATFDAADCGFPHRRLLINTGCLIIDFRKPWLEDDSFCFETMTRIRRNEAGKRIAEVVPEDWLFSRFVHSRGGRVLATRKIPLEHIGTARYPNTHAWGTAATDGGKPALVLPERKAVA